MAAVFCASLRRSAILARKRLIGTRRSLRPPVGIGAAAGVGIAGDGADDGAVAAAATGAACCCKCCSTSAFWIAPFLPLPCTSSTLRSFSLSILRTAGPALPALALSSVSAATGAAATASVLIRPSKSPLLTVSPVANSIDSITPALLATISRTTLSVSRSTIFSSTSTLSPTCLCQSPRVPSVTDSGN